MENQNLDFRVSKEEKTVYIGRSFDAPLPLVWDAFTKAELLDQWVAPKPMTAKTKYMDFKVGGRRFYAMIAPNGTEKWAVQEYLSITPKTHFKMYNTFADAQENREMPGSEWSHEFAEQGGKTQVCIVIYNESIERMEKIIDGFRVGFTMSMDNLDALLAELSGMA